ncbi:MAG: MgtC/SapB family protein [Oscillospiraceae bacterium]|nr:MgtC/SapB family protein [Oscillospiraceae bacterium]MBQ9939256.1 MgtC/SapB family protein [Oscillospiraceae bacterium]
MPETYIFADPIVNLLGDWSAELNILSVTLRVLLSILLSAIIGCERANKRHAAGLRTFILVSFSSTVAVILDEFFALKLGANLTIISAAAVIGIAVISSNTILYSSKNQIKGLTTSVALWSCCIIGLTVGSGLYLVSIICFAALLCSLSILPGVETFLKNRSNHFEIHLELKNKSNLQDFVTTLRQLGLKIDDIEANPAYNSSGLSVYSISLTITGKELKKYKEHSEIIEALSTLEYVYYIEEM